MIKTYNPVSDVRNECVDLTKRLYRAITDVSRQLDERHGTAQTCDDLFVQSLEAQRVKLREYCERLMFLDPLGYGHKSEEILWRKGYYDVVATAKKMRKNNKWNPMETAYMQNHLSSGVGHYHHLIFRIQIEFKLDLRGLVDFPLLNNDEGLVKGKSSSSKVIDQECTKWAKKTTHRCLVYLGDLSRYILDLYPGWDTGLTVRYYLQALNLSPDIGMPHNQLGTLTGTRNYSIDAAYHYMRCLMCQQSFEGAESNLQRIFEKNNKWLEDRYCERGNSAEKLMTPSEHIRCLISRFLLLADVWFFDKTVLHINELCHQIVGDLVQCLKFNSPIPSTMDLKVDMENGLTCENDEAPEYLRDEVIYKIVIMSLLCAGKLQASNSGQHSIAVAFILGILSKLTRQVIDHIQNSVFNRSLTPFTSLIDVSNVLTANSSKIDLRSDPTTSSLIESSPSSALSLSLSTTSTEGRNGVLNKPNNKVQGNKLKKLRRRRRRISENSSDESDAMDDDDSEVSDSEEHLAFSTDDELGEDSGNEVHVEHAPIITNGMSKTNSLNQSGISNGLPDIKVNGLKSEESSTALADPITQTLEESMEIDLVRGEMKALDPSDLIELVAGDRILDIVKILLDWLRGDAAVIEDCSINSRDLLSEISLLLNLINLDAKRLKSEPLGAKIYKLKDIDNVFQKVPLPEDIDIKGICLRSFNEVHNTIDWEYLRHHCLHAKEEALLRVYKLVGFGHFLVSNPDLGVTFDSELRRFFVSEQLPVKTNEAHKLGHGESAGQEKGKKTNETITPRSNKETPRPQKGALMKNMHALWLRGEVKALESQKRSRDPVFSPYLAVDVDALILHTPLVKQLVGARKFILLIPTVVMAALDDLKGEVPRAREINRWLGLQHEKVNRFVRVQGPNEQMPIPLIKYPKKKDKEAWMFFQVVECCQYFNTKYGSNPNVSLVTLLTGQRNCIAGANDEIIKGFSPMGIAKTAGINLEYIETFHSKWKTSSKSHG